MGRKGDWRWNPERCLSRGGIAVLSKKPDRDPSPVGDYPLYWQEEKCVCVCNIQEIFNIEEYENKDQNNERE